MSYQTQVNCIVWKDKKYINIADLTVWLINSKSSCTKEQCDAIDEIIKQLNLMKPA